MKVFSILGMTTGIVSADESANQTADNERSGCLVQKWAHFSNGYGMFENDSMENNRGYTHQDNCKWKIFSGFNSDDTLMIRFKRFDLEDSKYCDANPNNDKKGPPSVFELTFQDEVGDWVSEKFCHTLGEDRFLHRTARSGTNRNFESGNPRNFKHKKGENLMSWTQLNAKEVSFELAVGQGANINGFYKGFQIEYAVVSDLTHQALKDQINAFLTNQDNYGNLQRSGQIRSIRKFIEAKMKKANKQNGVKCVAEVDNVPNFIKEAWEKVTNMSELVSFLNGENREEGDAFQGYFNFVHGGCWKKIDSLENMNKWHSRFSLWLE